MLVVSGLFYSRFPTLWSLELLHWCCSTLALQTSCCTVCCQLFFPPLYLRCEAKPTGLHPGSNNHISQPARRLLLRLLLLPLPSLPPRLSLFRVFIFLLSLNHWVSLAAWLHLSSGQLSRAVDAQLCSSSGIDFCIICLYFTARLCAWKNCPSLVKALRAHDCNDPATLLSDELIVSFSNT